MVKGATDVTALISVLKAAGQHEIKRCPGDHPELATFGHGAGESP